MNTNAAICMNAFLGTNSVSAAVAPAETSAFNPETTNTAQSIAARAIDFARSLNRYAAAMAQGFAYGLTALYFVGAAALSVAVLYYTFAR
jgi:hypothetical protein